MGSSSSKINKKAQKEAQYKLQKEAQQQADEFCSTFSSYMTKKGLPNFKELTTAQREAIVKIYKNLSSNNVNRDIRTAIENSKSSIQVFSYSQKGNLNHGEFDHIGNLQDHEYRLLVGRIMKQKFPLTTKMKLKFSHDRRNVIRSDLPFDRDHSVCSNYVTISWDDVSTKKQDVIRCREYVTDGKSLRWEMCKTSDDVIIYIKLVKLRRHQLRKKAISACRKLKASTVKITTPDWDRIIPKFTGDDSDFKRFECSDYTPPDNVEVVGSLGDE